jgi:hypothetical protein
MRKLHPRNSPPSTSDTLSCSPPVRSLSAGQIEQHLLNPLRHGNQTKAESPSLKKEKKPIVPSLSLSLSAPSSDSSGRYRKRKTPRPTVANPHICQIRTNSNSNSVDGIEFPRAHVHRSASSSSDIPKIRTVDDATLDEYSSSVFDEESTLRDYQEVSSRSEFSEYSDSQPHSSDKEKLAVGSSSSGISAFRQGTKTKNVNTEQCQVTINPLYNNRAAQSYITSKKQDDVVTIENPLYRNYALHQKLMSDKQHPKPGVESPKSKRGFFKRHSIGDILAMLSIISSEEQ